MGNTRLCWQSYAVCNIVCSFHSDFMVGRGDKMYLLKKKRPRREQWIPSVIETKHEHHFCQASVLAFFTIPKASLTGEGSEKNSASRLKGQKKIKQNILNLMN